MDVVLWLIVLLVVGALVAAIYARGRERSDRPSPDRPSAGAEPDAAPAPDVAGGEAPARPEPTPGDRPAGPGAEDTVAPEPGDPAPGEAEPPGRPAPPDDDQRA